MSSKKGNTVLALAHFCMAALVATSLGDGPSEIRNPAVSSVNPNGTITAVRIDIKWLLVAFTIITGIFHLVYANRGYAGKLRYLEYAITASIMIMIIQLLSGEKDLPVLVGVFGLMASTMLLGYVQDEKIKNRGLSNAAFWFGWVPYTVAWALVIRRFMNTVSNAAEVPGFVKAIIWIELVVFSCFALTQYWFVVRPGAVYNEKRYDATYNILSITAKATLVMFSYSGLKNIQENPQN